MIGFKFISTQESLECKKLILAAKAYCAEVDVEYCHRLGNWMRDGHYLGFYTMSHNDLMNHVSECEKVANESVKLIESWNKCNEACDNFYPCLAIDDRLHLVKKAMKNKFFKANWHDALVKLYKLMKEEFQSDDPRSFIRATVQWFCVTSPEKFSVAKILEGEYGQPPKIKRKIKAEKSAENVKSEFNNPKEALDFFNTL